MTEKQQLRVEMIPKTDKRLYRTYCLKESLRLLLKLKDVGEAESELKRWLWRDSHSRIPAVHDLYEKIKLVIRKAYGFRNTKNMIDMVYLVCSNLRILLPNRKPIPRL